MDGGKLKWGQGGRPPSREGGGGGLCLARRTVCQTGLGVKANGVQRKVPMQDEDCSFFYCSAGKNDQNAG
jgi:hypothetical protein